MLMGIDEDGISPFFRLQRKELWMQSVFVFRKGTG